MKRTQAFPFLVAVSILLSGCGSSGTQQTTDVVLKGPDGASRKYKEWPLDPATLRGATLTCAEFPELKWEFAANGTHEMTNGGKPMPAGMNDFITDPAIAKAEKLQGTWSLNELKAMGLWEMEIKFVQRLERGGERGCGLFVMPYHSSAEYVHFVRDYGGLGGAGRVFVFKIAMSEGRSLPTPPK